MVFVSINGSLCGSFQHRDGAEQCTRAGLSVLSFVRPSVRSSVLRWWDFFNNWFSSFCFIFSSHLYTFLFLLVFHGDSAPFCIIGRLPEIWNSRRSDRPSSEADANWRTKVTAAQWLSTSSSTTSWSPNQQRPPPNSTSPSDFQKDFLL